MPSFFGGKNCLKIREGSHIILRILCGGEFQGYFFSKIKKNTSKNNLNKLQSNLIKLFMGCKM
jgi:hypothetical protein